MPIGSLKSAETAILLRRESGSNCPDLKTSGRRYHEIKE